MKFCRVAIIVFVLDGFSFARPLLLPGSRDGPVLDPDSVPATAVIANFVGDSKKGIVVDLCGDLCVDLCGDHGAVGRESQPRRVASGKGHADTVLPCERAR